ncbi:MAG: haloacid dehalogenase-like hydrolase [Bacteroidales bacterium]|nr:haloacid dehalogenase-like hydrolase [Bacteroidales bacterium]
MKREKIAVFDFDGTLIRGDSFIDFAVYVHGWPKFIMALLKCSHLLILYKLKMYSNNKVKEHLFGKLFKGISLNSFDNYARQFFIDKAGRILRAEAIACLKEHKRFGNKVIIVSASPSNWIIPFANALGVDKVLSTEVEIDDNRCLTGRFSNINCYGIEKVNRLKTILSEREKYYVYAYGDSKGDKEMLEFADEGYYRIFNNIC